MGMSEIGSGGAPSDCSGGSSLYTRHSQASMMFGFFKHINNATWKQCNMGNRRGTKNTRIFCMGIHNILSVRGIPNILGGCNIS